MNKEQLNNRPDLLVITDIDNDSIPIPAPVCKSLNQLVKEAADVLLVMADDLLDTKDMRNRSIEYRYLTFGIMEKSGYTHQQIADYFKMNRENVTKALSKLDDWLDIYADTKGSFQRLQSRIL